MNSSDLRDALRRDAELAGLPPTDLVHRVAGLRRRSHRRRAAVVGCALAIVAAVVGVSALDGVRGQDRGADAAAVVDVGGDVEARAQEYRQAIADGGGAGSRALSGSSLVEFLPGSQYLARNGVVISLSDAVVVGHITSVSPGHAHYWPADAEDRPPVEVPFDDPRALSRTIHAEVAVTEVIAGQITEDTIVVGFRWGTRTPFAVAADGLPAMGDMVFFLDDDSPVFAHDSTVQYGVAEDGTMLAEVGSDGGLTLPAIEPERAVRLLAQTPTVNTLRAAAQQPARVLPIETLED